jgi:hypothetical protein
MQIRVMGYFRFVTPFLFLALCAGLSHAQKPVSPEMVLTQAMSRLDNENRVMSSGVAIEKLAKMGFLPIKPDDRADYVDYRRVRKPLSLFGHKVVVIEEEYLTQYIGCCVNPGIGMVIETNGAMGDLNAFLVPNKCHKRNPDFDPAQSLKLAGVKPKADATYVIISCRQDDLRDDLQ